MTKLILNYVVFIAIITASFVLKKSDDILKLQKEGVIDLSISGTSSSTHYLMPIELKITNNTRDILDIKIPAGLHFQSIDENDQDIISTQRQIVKVAPNSYKNVQIEGVCIQQLNRAPSSSSKFTLAKTAPKKMYELAQFIDQKQIRGAIAQDAMWVISDGNDLSSIIGLSPKHEQELLNKTASIMELPPVKIEDFKRWKKERVEPVYTSSITGYYKFEFPRKTRVNIAVFNENNVLIKEIINQEVEAGFHKIDYQLETTDLEGHRITSQLIAYNKVLAKRNINLR
jgi:hypothetical protein